MGTLFKIPLVRSLHERQLLFPVVVILVVAAILAQGALQGDPPVEAADAEGAPPPSPRPVPAPSPRRPDLEKTPLTYFDDYWGQLRERVERRIVAAGPDEVPAVVVMPGLALTSAAAGEAVLDEIERARLLAGEPDEEAAAASPDATAATEPSAEEGAPDAPPTSDRPAPDPERGAGAALPHGLLAVDRERGFALFSVDASEAPAFELALPAAVPSGAYVAAVARDRSGRTSITPGHLVAARGEPVPPGQPSLEVSMRLRGPGASAIVDLDGALVGVAVDDGAGGARLLSSSVVRRVVAELRRVDRCRAIVVAPLDESVLEVLGIEHGLLVERVRAEAFVPEPSLRPGDVILEWDGEPVDTVEALYARSDLLAPGTLIRYRVLRGRRQVGGGTVLPGPDCAPPGVPPVRLAAYGLALRWTSTGDGDGWRVAAAAPDGAAARAGVELGDVVLAVDGREAGDLEARALFERLERRGEAAALTLRRADRVRIVAVRPDAS